MTMGQKLKGQSVSTMRKVPRLTGPDIATLVESCVEQRAIPAVLAALK